MNKIIKVEDLTVAYFDKPVLWDIDVEFPEGQMSAIIGPNGAGKSTLLKTILGLIKPLSGEIKIDNKSYKDMYKEIGYVPQKESVNWDFPTTVFEVVLMGTYGKLGWFKRPGKKEKVIANDAIEKMGMTLFSNHQISELSGGQQQRVFLARALAQQAQIYFLDEPFAGVDKKTELIIIQVLKELKKEGKTIITVHHDLNTVEEYYDYVVLVNKKLINSGSVKDVFTREVIEKTFDGKLS